MIDSAMLSPQEIKQYLLLQQKSEPELRAICEGMELRTEGSHEELLTRLMNLRSEPQVNILKPQTIPLYSKKREQPLEAADNTFKTWRKTLFSQNNFKKFELINSKGTVYQASMRYMTCTTGDINLILKHDYLSDRSDYKDLIYLLKENSAKFELNIVNKRDKRGNSWLMLHVAPRKAA